jgi:hypothetical protein
VFSVSVSFVSWSEAGPGLVVLKHIVLLLVSQDCSLGKMDALACKALRANIKWHSKDVTGEIIFGDVVL